jgi:alpha-mannosidase
MQRFVCTDDGERIVALFSAGLPEYEWEPRRGSLALTLLRCVGELSRGDLRARPGGEAGWKNETPEAQCRGEYTFRFHVRASSNGMADILRAADQWNAGPIVFARGERMESLPPALLSVDPSHVVLSAIKPADNGNGIIVRINNSSEEPVDAIIVCGRGIVAAEEVRLDESSMTFIAHSEQRIALRVEEGGVRSVRLNLKSF